MIYLYSWPGSRAFRDPCLPGQRLADMGTTPSSSRPKEEISTNGGFFSNLWLCGGADAIDENSTERSRRRVASADKETDGRKLRAGADDAKRVTESTESAS